MPDDGHRERVNVAALRNVFFHNSATWGEKRLPVIEEPSSSANSNAVCILTPKVNNEANEDIKVEGEKSLC